MGAKLIFIFALVELNYLFTDYLFLGNGELIKNGFIAYNKKGIIQDFGVSSSKEKIRGEYLKGGLCPGFINTHCHLELSHLESKINRKTGLIRFIKELQSKREINIELQKEAIQEADKKMWKEGIQAVGDISNNELSFEAKTKSTIRYHNFIELFGFDSTKAKDIYKKGEEVLAKSKDLNMECSIVPHSPYSVSADLMNLIFSSDINKTKSIHNQESKEENSMYKHGKGAFLKMLADFNIDTSSFKKSGKSSLKTYLKSVHKESPLLLIHNTYTEEEDIDFVLKEKQNVYWGLCPKANLYIENTLPKIELFFEKDLKCAIGTDSLASNDSLSILEELKTIHSSFPKIPLTTLIKWACLNGANALQMKGLGLFQKNTKPGIVHIQNLDSNGELVKNTIAKRVI